jgi:hemolysin activation/secretion protein
MFDLRVFGIPAAWLAAACLWVCSGALSQAAAQSSPIQPSIGEALRQVQPQARPDRPAVQLPQLGGDTLESRPQAGLDDSTLEARAFEVEGNRIVDTATLLGLVADGTGRQLSLSDLFALADRITLHYRRLGYFLARAYIPAQTIRSGVIRIAVLEGHYGTFWLKNSSQVQDETLLEILGHVKAERIISQSSLERALLIAGDTPGVQIVDVNLIAGQEHDTTDVLIQTESSGFFNGYALMDNHGSAYTGIHRLIVGVDFNSPTGKGDRLSFNAMSSEGGGLSYGRVSYSALLMSNGLRAQVSLGQTRYRLGETFRYLQAAGDATTWDVALSYPVVRTQAQTLEFSLNGSFKTMEDRQDATETKTPKSLRSTSASLNLTDRGEFLGFEGSTRASASLTWGELRINEATAREFDSLAVRTAGQFGKVEFSLSRTSFFPENFVFTAGLRVQQALSRKNLDGTEKMAVSGSAGVLAYPGGELSGSNAALVELEISRAMPAWVDGLKHQWQVSGQWGQASAARPVSDVDKRRSLAGLGLGWSGQYRGLTLKLQAAHRLSDKATSEPYPKTKLLAQVGMFL